MYLGEALSGALEAFASCAPRDAQLLCHLTVRVAFDGQKKHLLILLGELAHQLLDVVELHAIELIRLADGLLPLGELASLLPP